MKKLTILFTALSIVLLASCGKYDDGPGFSLRSKTARVAGEWTVEKYTSGGVDYTSLVTGLSVEFTKSGSYTETYSSQGSSTTDNGKWALTSNDEDLTITYNDGTVDTYKILRLTNSEMWLSNTSSGTTDEIHFKTK